MSNDQAYLRAILSLLARQTFPPDKLATLVGRERQIAAYNLCDGTRTQSEIAKELSIDSANFSKTVGRWAEIGILVKIVESKTTFPLHLYPLPSVKNKKDTTDE